MHKGDIVSAGEGLPGPTARVGAYMPGNAAAAAQSGLGEYPIISTGGKTAAATTVSGIGGGAVAVAAPDSLWIGDATRASATADATGLYGGSKSQASAFANGGQADTYRRVKREDGGDAMPLRVSRCFVYRMSATACGFILHASAEGKLPPQLLSVCASQSACAPLPLNTASAISRAEALC